jgi:uncharacterized membrane protein YkoI
MKRSTIVAVIAATAVIGGGTAVGAGLSGTGGEAEAGRTAADLRTVADEDTSTDDTDDDTDDTDDSDDRDDRDDRDDSDDRDDRDDDSGRTAAPRDIGDDTLGQVIRTALDTAPGHVTEVDLDDDGHWDVEIAGEDDRTHELRISLDGDKVLDHERENEDDDDHAQVERAGVQAAEAARIAEKHAGARADDVDLDVDDGVWDVELWDAKGTKWELNVDIHSGEVTKTEQTGRTEQDD